MDYRKLWFDLLEHLHSEIRDCQRIDRYSVGLSKLYELDSKETTLLGISRYMSEQMEKSCESDSPNES